MIEGQWRLEGDVITGWAMDTEKVRPLWVELLADDICLGATLADLDTPQAGGFYIPVPSPVLEESAKLDVRVANTDIALTNMIEKDETGQLPGLTGEIYVDRGLRISGWAADPANSDEKAQIRALIDGKVVAHTVAAERCYRPALADGHGFSLELPPQFADGKAYIVHVQDDLGRPLPGSPVRVRSLPKKADEWLKEQKNITRPIQDLLADMLETLEERLPGVISQGKYEYWKKVFPVPAPDARVKAGIVNGALPLLRGQSAEIKRGGEFIFLPGNASSLHKHAIAHMTSAMRNTQAAIIYADGEDAAGLPLFKPAWNREQFLTRDYLGPCLIRTDALGDINPESINTEAAAERFQLIMQAAASGPVAHLPLPLSVAEAAETTPERQFAVNAWLSQHYPGSISRAHGPDYALTSRPLVSIIIPTRDHGDLLETCLNSLWFTDWSDLEIIIIDNGTVEDKALAVLGKAEERDNVCVLRRPGVFNYAALNNEAARQARGAHICFLNNDTEALDTRWLAEMAKLLDMAGSRGGAVGAKLLWPNGLVQHGGVVVGTHQLAAHVGNQWLDDEPGYMGINQTARQCSAVTAACMLTPKELFLTSGGFDERRFPIAFNDVDYCLRLGAMGKRIFWTPRARLAHHESASRGRDQAPSAKARSEREMAAFRTLWGHYDDVFYNPNLPLSAAAEPYAGLAFPPRRRDARLTFSQESRHD